MKRTDGEEWVCHATGRGRGRENCVTPDACSGAARRDRRGISPKTRDNLTRGGGRGGEGAFSKQGKEESKSACSLCGRTMQGRVPLHNYGPDTNSSLTVARLITVTRIGIKGCTDFSTKPALCSPQCSPKTAAVSCCRVWSSRHSARHDKSDAQQTVAASFSCRTVTAIWLTVYGALQR